MPALHGLPARVLPLEVWHTASVGIDLWLAAIAYGAAQVWVLVTHEEAPAYREAIDAQMKVAQAILSGLGFAGEHFRIVGAGEVLAAADGATRASGPAPAARRRASRSARPAPALLRLDAALRRPPAATVRRAATFAVQPDKRTTLDLAFEHLLREAPTPADAIALPAPAERRARSARSSSTRAPAPCAWPASAPAPKARSSTTPIRRASASSRRTASSAASARAPARKTRSRSCRGCCSPTAARRAGRRASCNEAEPFRCVRCAKPFGTLRAIEAMVAKLAGHSMFQGRAAERLQMCGDCRVIDLHSDPGEVRITEL